MGAGETSDGVCDFLRVRHLSVYMILQNELLAIQSVKGTDC